MERMNPLDIVGLKINFITVIKSIGRLDKYHWYLYRCICGIEKKTRRQSIINRAGRPIKSCGCQNQPSTIGIRSLKHGKCKSSIYGRWQSMLRRCYNKNNPKYHRYGGRGIKVSQSWHEFKNFYADMGDPPSNYHSLDRIDNNGDYKKNNCRWVDQKIQQNNRGNNKFLTFNGETKTIAEWARIYRITPTLLRQRLERDKLPIEIALIKR